MPEAILIVREDFGYAAIETFVSARKSCNVSCALQYSYDFNRVPICAVENNVPAKWKAEQPGSEFFTPASRAGLIRQQSNRFV